MASRKASFAGVGLRSPLVVKEILRGDFSKIRKSRLNHSYTGFA
jgi:hypothetical protein